MSLELLWRALDNVLKIFFEPDTDQLGTRAAEEASGKPCCLVEPALNDEHPDLGSVTIRPQVRDNWQRGEPNPRSSDVAIELELQNDERDVDGGL